MSITLSIMAGSALVALWLSISLLEGTASTLISLAVAGLALIFALITIMGFTRQVAVLRVLCEKCDDALVYVPRRFIYACRAGGGLLCYSSANNRVLRVLPREEFSREKFDPWRDPIDFYCAKPLEGKLRKGEGRAVFEGIFIYVDPYGPSLVRARGRVISERPGRGHV